MSDLLKKMQDTLESSCLEAYALGKKEKQSKIDQLKAEKEAVLELAKQWQETARQLSITDDKHVICSLLSCAEEVEKALRGGHE